MAGVEILVMFILGSTGMKESVGKDILDALLLSLLSAPLLYLFVIRTVARRLSEQAALSNRILKNELELEVAAEKLEIGARLKSLINNIPGIVYQRDRDRSLSFLGGKVELITGYIFDQFKSGSVGWKEIIHPDDRELLKEAFCKASQKKLDTLRLEYRIRNKDGGIRWIEDTQQLFFAESGVVDKVEGLIFDITNRKWAEEETRKMAKFPSENPDPIMRISAGGTLLYINKSGSGQLSEWNLQVGKIAPPLLRDAVSRALNDGSREMLELEYGESTYSFSVSPVRDAGYANLYGRDVTERKHAEGEKAKLQAQLQLAQKMEAVGTLAGGIAHDFNNSLTGIVGFGELLRMRMAGDEQALHDLDEILRCAEHATTLTRQLLTYARRQVIEPVNLNLSALIADLMMLVGKVVGEHIEVKSSLKKNVPTIFADRGQIEQVVMNLSLNARDAMPDGGRLAVETEDVHLEEEYVLRNPYMKMGRYALLTVSDTGVGMDEKTCERVFEPFFTTKGPDKGTGLGLAMVYGIVKQHGGFIHLYSEPGKGTAFKVYFPAIEAQPDAVPAIRREEIVRGGTETILLAEDEEGICALAERILTGFGYKVLVARNGEEALELFSRNKEIVLAVLDVVMPRKGGKEAFEEMYKANPKLKVIFMSGYTRDGIHDSFVLIAGMPFLQKPFGPTILARKIREVLDTP